ncbi:MAG: endonuclease [Bacteroidetes bacterium B1(2017)]|nr:MAG: endonuclease [Bacteroidetes bacterium B1(2017)]
MKSILVILLSLLFCFNTEAQNKKKICVAFYNQENLFDTLDTPNKIDEEFLPSGTYKWNTEKYTNKLANMSEVILAMNDKIGPDFIGMCEVENNLVLTDLCKQLKKGKQDYGMVWFDSPDERGIDNALLYKKSAVKKVSSHMFMIDTNGIGGDNTRGIVMADFTLTNASRLVILVNHFPSRREGEKESEFKRLFVAQRLKNICDSIQKKDPNTALVIMGDFNDYPDNASIKDVLKAKAEPSETGTTDFYNPMNQLLKQGMGSYKHKGEWNFLDQFMVNKNLLNPKAKVSYEANSASTFKQDWMLETEEKYKGNPKRTFGGKKYLNGYSDHLPIYMYLNLN